MVQNKEKEDKTICCYITKYYDAHKLRPYSTFFKKNKQTYINFQSSYWQLPDLYIKKQRQSVLQNKADLSVFLSVHYCYIQKCRPARCTIIHPLTWFEHQCERKVNL